MDEITEVEPLELRERWMAIKTALDDAWDALAEIMKSTREAIKQIALYFAEMAQRAYLCQLLPQWIPQPVQVWLARHWPRALLPDLAEAIEWMKAEAVQ